jgi:hypothetical protein
VGCHSHSVAIGLASGDVLDEFELTCMCRSKAAVICRDAIAVKNLHGSLHSRIYLQKGEVG